MDAEPGLDQKRITQILIPAGVAALVVVLIGVLISMSDWNGQPATDKLNLGPTGKSGSAADADKNDAGMSDAAPSADAPEWKDLDQGLKIWDVKEGEGEACPRGASVTIHYSGWLTNGTLFDSSRGKGRPDTFELPRLVQGWQIGIPGMKPGGIRRLLVPSALGYGATGQGKIPPNATLVFEVKLLAYSAAK